MQLGGSRPGPPENRNIGVSVFPQPGRLRIDGFSFVASIQGDVAFEAIRIVRAAGIETNGLRNLPHSAFVFPTVGGHVSDRVASGHSHLAKNSTCPPCVDAVGTLPESAGTWGRQRINIKMLQSGDSWQNEWTSARPLAPVSPDSLQSTDARQACSEKALRDGTVIGPDRGSAAVRGAS